MNIQSIAEKVLEDLNNDLLNTQDNVKMLQGAMQGVRLLFQKISESQAENEQKADDGQKKDSKSGSGKK